LDAAAAECALPRIITPREFVLAGREGNGPCGATKSADRTSDAERGIHPNQSPESHRDGWTGRKTQRGDAAPEVPRKHGKDIHARSLIRSVDTIASPVNMRAHRQ